MNNRGQIMGFGFIMGIVMLVVAVLLITSFWPVIQDQFDGLRDQDELNCYSSTDLCNDLVGGFVGIGSNTTCYNESAGNSHTTTCAMLSIGPPLILIMLILGAIGLIMRSGQPSLQPQYQGY